MKERREKQSGNVDRICRQEDFSRNVICLTASLVSSFLPSQSQHQRVPILVAETQNPAHAGVRTNDIRDHAPTAFSVRPTQPHGDTPKATVGPWRTIFQAVMRALANISETSPQKHASLDVKLESNPLFPVLFDALESWNIPTQTISVLGTRQILIHD